MIIYLTNSLSSSLKMVFVTLKNLIIFHIFVLCCYTQGNTKSTTGNIQFVEHRIVKRHAAPDPQPRPQPKGGGNTNTGRLSDDHESLRIYHEVKADISALVFTGIALTLALVAAIVGIYCYWKETLCMCG